MKFFVPVLLICGIFFFLMLGVTILAHAPTPDENLTPALAEHAHAIRAFHAPIQLGWQGVPLAVAGCGILAAIGLIIRRLRGRGY